MPVTRKLPAKVLGITRHAADLYTVTLEPGRKTPRFNAGQFLHLALDPYDPSAHWPESRAFSIANSPERRNEIRIVFSVKGTFTQRMAAEIREGTEVWVKMPHGSVNITSDEEVDTVLIAGGTGITPFISFLEHACDVGSTGGVRLFYGVRSKKYLIFEHTVRNCQTALPDFTAWVFSESGDVAAGLDVQVGRLRIDAIWELLPQPMESTYYLSGPPDMIKAFRTELASRGVSAGKILSDDWE